MDGSEPAIRRPASALTVLVTVGAAALAAIASAAGVLLRGDLTTRTFTTARGSEVDLLVNGIYRLNGQNIGAEGIGWDLVTLLVVVPALVFTLPALRAGSLRARLIALGLLAYLAYQYIEYSVFLAYGPSFLVYVGTFSLSAFGIALLVGGIALDELPARFGPRFPRRAVIGYGVSMALLLGGMWLPLVIRTIGVDDVPELYGSTTFVVPVFDLGVLLPLGIALAVTLWRWLPIGYLVASVVIVKGLAMASAIVAMLIVEWLATGQPQLPPIAVFGALAVVSGLIAWRLYGSLDREVGRAGRVTLGKGHQPA